MHLLGLLRRALYWNRLKKKEWLILLSSMKKFFKFYHWTVRVFWISDFFDLPWCLELKQQYNWVDLIAMKSLNSGQINIKNAMRLLNKIIFLKNYLNKINKNLTLLSLTACRETHSNKLPRLRYSIIELLLSLVSISSLLHLIWLTMQRWNCTGKSMINLSTTHSLSAPITRIGR